MTINERITKIRTDAGKSKVEFAKDLNVSDSLISHLESGKRALTSRTFSDICERFNVNPDWLRDGIGEPYNITANTTLKLLKAEYSLDELDMKIIEGYLELSPIERQVFKDYIKKMKGAD